MRLIIKFVLIALMVAACACDKDNRPQQPQPTGDTLDPNEPENPGLGFTETDSFTKDFDDRGNGNTAAENWENFRIPQGQHYNNLRNIGLFPHDSLAFEVVFDSTAIYQTQNPANQADWNKLMGFSDCGTHHHTNSARVVWRYLPASGGFQLGEYYYSNGSRSFSALGNFQLNDTIPVKLYISKGYYQVEVGQKTGQEQRACNTSIGRYMLFPYFGGDETAPHDINIYIHQTYP